MSEDRTGDTNSSRSFEERVFARFDAIDNRFEGIDHRFNKMDERLERVETRIEALEAKQYDTKPIWERALSEIGKLGMEIQGIHARIDSTNASMDAGFEQIRKDFNFALHGVERKIDVLNHNILDLRAEQRYVDSRLEKLESQPKPS